MSTPLPITADPDSIARPDAPLGWIPTWIVGRRYYRAAPPPDTVLVCERQPDNPHDPEAVAVYAPGAGQVGHLPRCDAAYLAPLMDRGAIRLSARLNGDDDPENRAAIRLEVWADLNAAVLAGPDADTVEAIWHTLLVCLWQRHVQYSYEALDAFRARIRELAHAGDFWPATQLIYRLLKGVVGDGEAAAAEAKRLATQKAAEETARKEVARQAARRASFACVPGEVMLTFGHIQVLPLRACRPAAVLPLTDALRDGTAMLSSCPISGTGKLRVQMSGDTRLVALQGERLDTTIGVLRVVRDALLCADGNEKAILSVRREAVPEGRVPIFLLGHERAEPALPVLPAGATGFALFHGGELLQINLFAHAACAAVALDTMRQYPWQLSPGVAPREASTAADRVRFVLANLVFYSPNEDGVVFGHQPGVRHGYARFVGDRLAFLRVSLRDAEFNLDPIGNLPCDTL